VAFATAAEWFHRLALAHNAGRLHDEQRRLGRYPVIVIDEVGYIPFEAEEANLFFQFIRLSADEVTAVSPSTATCLVVYATDDGGRRWRANTIALPSR